MIKTIQFPIKGTFYYAAELAIEMQNLSLNVPVKFKREPNNPYDLHAIQIWSSHSVQEDTSSQLLLGYVPRALAKQLSPSMQAGIQYIPCITHLAQKGKQIEINCQIQVNFSWFITLKIQLICFWIKQQQVLNVLKKRFKFY